MKRRRHPAHGAACSLRICEPGAVERRSAKHRHGHLLAGAVLYKLLTGVAPRENNGHGPDRQPADPAVSIRMCRPTWISCVAKAMRPEPEDRYGSVDEFAADIRAALAWRPVQARGGDVWYRTRRHVRRYWIPLRLQSW